jgi:hypothetical protein
MTDIILLPQIEYEGKDWVLFNTYRFKREAYQDKELITRLETMILKSRSRRYYLYQAVQGE